jgi:hypothetical protein
MHTVIDTIGTLFPAAPLRVHLAVGPAADVNERTSAAVKYAVVNMQTHGAAA